MPVMFGVLLLVAAPRTPVHMAGRPWREAAIGAVFGDPVRNGGCRNLDALWGPARYRGDMIC
jgi:hypothetical protein